MDRKTLESLTSSLTLIISNLSDMDPSKSLSDKEIEDHVEQFLNVPKLKALNLTKSDKAFIINKVLMQGSYNIGSEAVVLENPEVERWLDDARAEIDWKYWRHYKDMLITKGRDNGSLIETEKVIDEILDLSGNPNEHDGFRRKGLVMGNVQSGKTESYLGLINKAIDVGYKIIILLGGHQNGLRRQTQLRVEEGVIGFETKDLGAHSNKQVGVGKTRPKDLRVIPFTSSDDDFDSKTLDVLYSVGLRDINGPVILTTKKWHTVLDNLYKWLKRTHDLDPTKNKLLDFPLLFIDDEADYATPNVKAASRNDPQYNLATSSKDTEGDDEEEDMVTATNGNIRRILSLFKKSTYVAYTATPFANIFIHPDAVDERFKETILKDDLYPTDFMIKLHRPSAYLGQDFFFNPNVANENANSFLDNKRPVVEINDNESFIPLKHFKDVEVGSLPPSLKEAIRAFFISCAARAFRGEEQNHMTMMINVSNFNLVQGKVCGKVEKYVKNLQDHIDTYSNLSPSERDQNPVFEALKKTHKSRFDINESFDEIVTQLRKSLKIKVIATNVTTGEGLNYEQYPNGLWTIVVGGLKLSRGLTLEGLNISYFARSSKGVDTLMQMCRWFGYKRAYQDLCKVYLPRESIYWYTHITEVVNDLYHQLTIMQEAGKTPNDFGLKVRDHPGALMITAANKRKNAFERRVYMDMWGQTIRRMRINSDSELNSSNLKKTTKFVESLIDNPMNQMVVHKSKSLIFEKVTHEIVLEYIKQLKLMPDIHPDELLYNYINKLTELEMPEFKVCVFNNIEQGSTDWTNGKIIPEDQKVALKTYNFCGYDFNLKLRTLQKDGNVFKAPASNLGDAKDESYYLQPETAKQIIDLHKGSSPNPFHFIKAEERDFPTLNIYLISAGVRDSVTKKVTIPHEKDPSVVFSISFPLLDNQKGETLDTVKAKNKDSLQSFLVTKRFVELYQKELAGF